MDVKNYAWRIYIVQNLCGYYLFSLYYFCAQNVQILPNSHTSTLQEIVIEGFLKLVEHAIKKLENHSSIVAIKNN